MRAGGFLLIWSTLFCSVSAAARWDLRSRNISIRGGLRGNFSSSAVQTITTGKESTSRLPDEDDGATSTTGVDDEAGGRSSGADGTEAASTTTIHDHVDPTGDETARRPSAPIITKTTTSVIQHTPIVNGTTSHTVGTPNPAPPYSPVPTTTTENCTHLNPDRPFTVFSVIYDETITFEGDPTDYTPPFSPLSTPTYCDDPSYTFTGQPTNTRPPAWTSARPPGTSGVDPNPDRPSAPEETASEELPTAELPSMSFPIYTKTKGTAPEPSEQPSKTGEEEVPGSRTPTKPTITFTTKDKNPSVSFQTREAPGFTQSWLGNGRPGPGGEHRTALGTGYSGPDRPPPVFTIIAGESQVIINQRTLEVKPDSKRTVTVDHGVFTILPTAVVAHGHTITRPLTDVDGNAQARPTGANLAAGDSSVTQTDMAVAGGELLTAIGPSIMVLRSTTYVYGPRRSEQTVVVDSDTVKIGTFGVSLHGITLGGPQAAATVTDYEIVGGATVTQIRPSIIIIDGVNYTITAGLEQTTTVVGGQTITVGPKGAIHDNLTISARSQIAITTTFQPSGTWGKDFPEETGSDDHEKDEAEDDAGAFVQPDFALSLTAIGIALGVLVMT